MAGTRILQCYAGACDKSEQRRHTSETVNMLSSEKEMQEVTVKKTVGEEGS